VRLGAAERDVERRTGSWRLARALRLAWESLAPAHRLRLARFWYLASVGGAERLPRIRLVPGLAVAGADAVAACSADGLTIEFRAALVSRLSVEALVMVCRHELRHAWQVATGRPTCEADALRFGGAWRPEWVAVVEDTIAGRLL